ncbi:hypothetical protein C0992_009297 [Termitomyces sp. T32_za158]|nr:hypothetical protein C0992_009297 [Termitomyces sp. T32_za158]
MAKEKRAHGPPAKKARVATSKPKLKPRGSPRPGKRTEIVDKGKKRRQDDDDDDGDDTDDDHDDDDDDEDPKPHTKPTTRQAPRRVLPTSFKIVAGSYEKLLYGLHGTVSPSPPSSSPDCPYTVDLTPIFIFPAHVSCIKAVAASPAGGKWLATGSADEIVKVWDLRRRKEVGGLMHHEGSITHLVFPSRSHLLSASEDGTLCLFRARDWSVLRALRGHKGRVNSVAVHPTGKVALSVGRDRALRMWDLMRGRGSASTKLTKGASPLPLPGFSPADAYVCAEAEVVRWSTDGSLFAVQTGTTIDMYTTSMEVLHTITHPSRLHDVHFCRRVVGDGELLLAAAEDKLVTIYAISSPENPPRRIATLSGHQNRVKAVTTLDIALPAGVSSRDATTIACTVSSDGFVHVYDLAMVPPPSASEEVVEIAPVAVYDTKGTRLTCLTLADGDADGGEVLAGEKRKEREGEGEGEGEESEDDAAEEWPSEKEEEDEEEDEEEEEEEEE